MLDSFSDGIDIYVCFCIIFGRPVFSIVYCYVLGLSGVPPLYSSSNGLEILVVTSVFSPREWWFYCVAPTSALYISTYIYIFYNILSRCLLSVVPLTFS